MEALQYLSQRIGAAVAAGVLLVAGVWGSIFPLLSGFQAAQRPNPRVPDGDPCCGHPDTWGEVGFSAGLATVEAAVIGGVLASSGALMVYAVRDRWPGMRRFVWVPAAGVVATASAITIALAVPP